MMLALLLTAALAQAPETAPLELERYLGTWYELARFDKFFERGCAGVRATYTRKEDGELKVENSCLEGSLSGKEKVATGRAWVPDPAVPGKLKVQFFWPFSGHYWVLEVADDYSWALVGHPEKTSCWIFSRTPTIAPALYESLLGKLRARGYDTTKLLKTAQPG
jgi:apolipoprotein D and lipocalin family protein